MVTKEIEILLNASLKEASDRGHGYVLMEHVLYVICQNDYGRSFLESCGVPVETLSQDLDNFFQQRASRMFSVTKKSLTSQMVERTVKKTIEYSMRSQQKSCNIADFLVAMMEEEESYAVHLLKKYQVTRFKLIKQISLFHQKNTSSFLHSSEKKQETTNKKIIFPEQHKVSDYLIDLNEKVKQKKIDPLIGRQKEIEKILLVLGRRKKNNPLLVGDPGVGKTALIEGLTCKIFHKEIHRRFHGYTVYSLELGTIIAGTKFRGDFEERFHTIFAYLKKKKKVIVFIDEIHTLVGTGHSSGEGVGAANLIKPLLSTGEILLIGATTYQEYRGQLQKDWALSRRFEKIDIDEPSIDDTTLILKSLSPYYESHHQIQYEESIFKQMASLSKEYFPEKKLPDAAIDLLDLAGSFTSLNTRSTSKPVVDLPVVERVITKMTGLPFRKMEKNQQLHFDVLEKKLRTQVYGQDHVIDKVLQTIKLARLKLNHFHQPMGCFLFTGPTGVGKTEFCKVLSTSLSMKLIRLDMSEFLEAHSIAKLIGAPPGYIGYNERQGELCEQVRKNPSSIVLLDEIEKAHPDVVNVFLQVMDYGNLTDSSGNKVNFCNSLLIMTSNLGAQEMSANSIGFVESDEKQVSVDKPVNNFFSPEFRNRLTAILKFNFLDKKLIQKILNKFIGEINTRLAEKKIYISLESSAVHFLINKGFDRKMGGRSISRIIEKEIKQKLVDIIFSHEDQLSQGGKIIFSYRPGTSEKKSLQVKVLPGKK